MKNETRCYWSKIDPEGLNRKHNGHPWHFGYLLEAPSGRSDKYWYTAFLFRNDDRTIFGIKEWVEQKPYPSKYFGKMAMRVISEKKFRDTFVTDDPEVKYTWKKR